MIGEALRLIRVYHDMKQNEAARKLEISNSYISEIEGGRKEPSLELIKRYEKVFKIPASSILFFSENISNPTLKDKSRSLVASKVISIMKILEEKAGERNGGEDS